MTNKTIYCVYRITNIVENKHYYGYKSTVTNPKEILGKTYFSSQKNSQFVTDQKQNPQNYKYKIVQIFNSKEAALRREIYLHNKFDVAKNQKFYNFSRQTSTKFDVQGRATIRHVSGMTCSVDAEEAKEKLKTGEWFGANFNIVKLVDRFGAVSKGFKDADCVISGEYVHATFGNTVIVETDDGNVLRCYKNDIRIQSGEYIISKRKRLKRPQESRETKQKKSRSHTGKPQPMLGKKMPPRTEEHSKLMQSILKGKKRQAEQCARNQAVRIGKRPAYDANGHKLGLMCIVDTRWGIEIFRNTCIPTSINQFSEIERK